jgi:Lon protease-like protein
MAAPLPLLPLNTVLFPGSLMPLRFFEPRYLEMLADCLRDSRPFGVALIRSGKEVGGPAVPFPIGTVARITGVQRRPDGTSNLTVLGSERFTILEVLEDKPYLTAVVEPLVDGDANEPSLSALALEASRDFKRYFALLLSVANRWAPDLPLPTAPVDLSFFLADQINVPQTQRYALLSAPSVADRLRAIRASLERDSPMLEALATDKAADDKAPSHPA